MGKDEKRVSDAGRPGPVGANFLPVPVMLAARQPVAFMVEALGWVSSLILVLTIAKQVYKQWRSGTSEGVSKWLFIGQITASVGFVTYSLLVKNWVFVVTNGLLLVQALFGGYLLFKYRRREQRQAQGTRPAHA